MSKAEAGYRKKVCYKHLLLHPHPQEYFSLRHKNLLLVWSVCKNLFVAMATMQFSFSKAFNFYRR